METKFTLQKLDQIVYNKLLFFVDRKKYRVDRKNFEHTIEYLIYLGDNLLGVFKITQRADGVVEYVGNGGGNDSPELIKGWTNLYYKMIIPLIEQEEQKIQPASNLTLRELARLASAGNKQAIKKISEISNRVFEVFGKPLLDQRDELLADPITKAIFLRLEKDLQSDDPIRRAHAAHASMQDILDIAKALPDELIIESISSDIGLAQTDNIIADNQGGTITYKRNEQGQTIITGGTVNPGYYAELGQGVAIKPESQIRLNHTTGNFQPGLYPPDAKDAILKITSETLAGLTENTNTQTAQVGTAKPEKLPRKELLDKACIEWANRESNGYLGRYTRFDFLQDYEEKTGLYIPRDEFRRALEDARNRGIIIKVNNRYKPKTRP